LFNDNNATDETAGDGSGNNNNNNAAKKKKDQISIAQNVGMLIPMSALQELLRRIVVTVDGSKIPAEGVVKQMTCKIKSREGAEGKISFPMTFYPPCFCGPIESEVVLPKMVPPLLFTTANSNEEEKSEEQDENLVIVAAVKKEDKKFSSVEILKNVVISFSPLFGRSCSVLLQPPELIATMRRNAMLRNQNSFVHFQCILNPRVSLKKRLENKMKIGAVADVDESVSSTTTNPNSMSRVSLRLHPGLLSHSTIQMKMISFKPPSTRHQENDEEGEYSTTFTHRIVPLLFDVNEENEQELNHQTLFYVSQTFFDKNDQQHHQQDDNNNNMIDGSSQLQIFAADDNHASSAKLSDLLRCISVVRIDQISKTTSTTTENIVDFDQIHDSLSNIMTNENYTNLREEQDPTYRHPQQQTTKIENDFIINPTASGFPQNKNDQQQQHHQRNSFVAVVHTVAAISKMSDKTTTTPKKPTKKENTGGDSNALAQIVTSAITSSPQHSHNLQNQQQQQQLQQPRADQNLYFCHCKLVTYEDHDLAIRSFVVHA
jgi:hypothetical protein